MLDLSERTEALLTKIFPDLASRSEVTELLIKECGNNVPFCDEFSPEDMERIRFSVLKLCNGDVRKLPDAIELANFDWRDLFMAAGFGDDVDAHKSWYADTIKS